MYTGKLNSYSIQYKPQKFYEISYNNAIKHGMSLSTAHIGNYGEDSSYTLKPSKKIDYNLSK